MRSERSDSSEFLLSFSRKEKKEKCNLSRSRLAPRALPSALFCFFPFSDDANTSAGMARAERKRAAVRN